MPSQEEQEINFCFWTWELRLWKTGFSGESRMKTTSWRPLVEDRFSKKKLFRGERDYITVLGMLIRYLAGGYTCCKQQFLFFFIKKYFPLLDRRQYTFVDRSHIQDAHRSNVVTFATRTTIWTTRFTSCLIYTDLFSLHQSIEFNWSKTGHLIS